MAEGPPAVLGHGLVAGMTDPGLVTASWTSRCSARVWVAAVSAELQTNGAAIWPGTPGGRMEAMASAIANLLATRRFSEGSDASGRRLAVVRPGWEQVVPRAAVAG